MCSKGREYAEEVRSTQMLDDTHLSVALQDLSITKFGKFFTYH